MSLIKNSVDKLIVFYMHVLLMSLFLEIDEASCCFLHFNNMEVSGYCSTSELVWLILRFIIHSY